MFVLVYKFFEFDVDFLIETPSFILLTIHRAFSIHIIFDTPPNMKVNETLKRKQFLKF